MITIGHIVTVSLLCSLLSLAAGFYYRKQYSVLKERLSGQKNKLTFLQLFSKKLPEYLKALGIVLDFKKINNWLVLAGRPFKLNAEEFVGAYIVLVAGTGVVAYTMINLGLVSKLIGFLFFAVPSVVPYFHIESEAQKARDKINTELINLIYSMDLGVSNGLDEKLLIQWAAEGKGLLASMLRESLKEVDLGGEEYLIFYRLAEDYNVPDAEEVGMLIKHAEKNGVDISQSLYDLARDFRYRRDSDLDKNIGKVKLTIGVYVVLAYMVMTFALIAGPIMVEYLPYLSKGTG
ncbi:hypothetical protein Dred_0807 [Desulforamulus reducens MI-1]|uniref:Type II secretion system protein GspF domain-containing protein n=1 Tax=Desulforamulus reducens (strain ATCC BAA-1160 / DSM 100696 / MI-1) TaxID=349161 RepID=A4J2P2_DESRM|nr:hypothetical protein [Desulforamulus reducens]ABO49345.1 hypothetical protein Dred_0807 [Desulforamulus reducens MI-1]